MGRKNGNCVLLLYRKNLMADLATPPILGGTFKDGAA